MTYRNILLTHDGSPEADVAVVHARDIAVAFGSRVLVIEAVESVAQVLAHMGASVEAISGRVAESQAEAARAAAHEHLARAHDVLAAAGVTDVRRMVIEGSPGVSITDTARREGCDLIVIGTHGRSGSRRGVLGSVADYVARHADCPVMLCRAPATSMFTKEPR